MIKPYHSLQRLLIVILLLSAVPVLAQNYFLRKAGGLTIDEGTDVSSDAAGNTYATGYFTTSASFGSTTLSSAGVSDVYVAKLDPNGNYLWAVSGGGNNSDRGLSIKTDAAGNSYVTGYFYNSASFGSQTVTSSGVQDVFIAKYDNSGTCLWAKRAGGSGADIGNGITIDNSGNVFVTGEFAGSATFGSTTLTSLNGTTDVFTTKLDGSGNFLWAKKGSASQTDRGIDVACDNSGAVYVAGQFSDTITFDVVHLNTMLNAIFVIKYDASGNEVWFRRIGGGTMNIGNSICSNGSDIYLTGDFQGTLTFYNTTNTAITGTYTNSIFVARYDTGGNLAWTATESSESGLSAKAIAINSSGNIAVGGNFRCRFNTLADAYGQGVYNSAGVWDIFAIGFNTSGTRQWARQMGGRDDQTCSGIAVNAAGNVLVTGTFYSDISVPLSNLFTGYPLLTGMDIHLNGIGTTSPYCSDTYYNQYATLPSNGNTDGFIGKPFDPARSTYDIYQRSGNGCDLDTIPVCIHDNTTFSGCSPDSVEVCGGDGLSAITHYALSTNDSILTPLCTYQWSNGGNGFSTFVSTTGNYILTITTADGCFTSSDTIHVTIHPPPPRPWISDNVVVNTNANFTQPIVICGDSVLLTATNNSNVTTTWYGPSLPNNGTTTNPVWVDSSGMYTVVVVDAFGCSNANSVQVTFDHPLDPIDPRLLFMEDTDLNDTITICDSTLFSIFPYDTITNPLAQLVCIPDLDTIVWTITPQNNTQMPMYTDCNNFGVNTAMVHQTGWYVFNAAIIRSSTCGDDTTFVTDSIYVIVNPTPPGIPIILNITAQQTNICPGDSVLLVASGFNPFIWSDGNTNDSIWVSVGGTYSVSASDTATNGFGCTTISSGIASIVMQLTPQPIVISNPADGVICPNDSVELTVNGSGTYQWQGPNGPFGGNTSSVYVNQPGQYFCIVTDSTGCQLLSNTVSIQQYNTPFLTASPYSILCPGDTITITLNTSPASNVQWFQPLSGSSFTQIVTQPGTYSCSVVSCNISTTANIVITLTNVFANATAPTAPVCIGDSITITGNSGMDFYQWQPGGATTQNITVTNSGTYILTTQDSGGCTATDSVSVSFQANPLTPPNGIDTSVCVGQWATLQASGGPVMNWYTPGGSFLTTGGSYTTGQLMQDTSFVIIASDGVCRSQPGLLLVDVIDCPPLTPNVFTPNGDGVNDTWAPYVPYAKGMRVRIYNRWGEIIYEWNDVLGYWDATYYRNGERVSDGVYYYVADIIDINDVSSSQHGFVHVITTSAQ